MHFLEFTLCHFCFLEFVAESSNIHSQAAVMSVVYHGKLSLFCEMCLRDSFPFKKERIRNEATR